MKYDLATYHHYYVCLWRIEEKYHELVKVYKIRNPNNFNLAHTPYYEAFNILHDSINSFLETNLDFKKEIPVNGVAINFDDEKLQLIDLLFNLQDWIYLEYVRSLSKKNKLSDSLVRICDLIVQMNIGELLEKKEYQKLIEGISQILLAVEL